VPITRSRRIDEHPFSKSGLLDVFPEDRFRGGTAADVSKTHEEHAHIVSGGHALSPGFERYTRVTSATRPIISLMNSISA